MDRALAQVLSVNPDLAVFRARYSAFTKTGWSAFNNLVDLDFNLAAAGEGQAVYRPHWSAVLARYRRYRTLWRLGNTRSATIHCSDSYAGTCC